MNRSDRKQALIEKAARAAYYVDPARTPWGGDDMDFDAPHWAAKDDAEKARKVACAVLAAVYDDIRRDEAERIAQVFDAEANKASARSVIDPNAYLRMTLWDLAARIARKGADRG